MDKTICIVGLGLIGGSIAKTLRKKVSGRLIAIDINQDTINAALDSEVIDEGGIYPEELLIKADLTIICLYPKQCANFINKYSEFFKKDSIITDVSGSKRIIYDTIKLNNKNDINFVGGHPMTGNEKKGFDYSEENMFDGCTYIITKEENTRIESIEIVKELAILLGSQNIIISSVKEHDEKMAYISQLPHIISVALKKTSLNAEDFSGRCYNEMTRVSDINEELWNELYINNFDDLSVAIDIFIKNMEQIKLSIKKQIET